MKWQILIATTVCRRGQFNLLLNELESQIVLSGLSNFVEVLWDEDNKEKSIGKKRQDLLNRSSAEYICYFDSDDWPEKKYVESIYRAISAGGFDCVGLLIKMTTNGENHKMCCHSLKYPEWENAKDGYDYVRNVTHFNPVKRSIAIKVGFSDLRFGEDKEYSDKITKLCKNEVFIDNPVFNYRYTNTEPHNQKYGIS